MTCKFLVLEEGNHSYQSKTGPRTDYRLSLRDVSTGVRCTNNFELNLPQVDVDAYKGKLRDTFVEVEISKFTAGFGGEIRIEGKLLGKPSNGSAPTPGK